MLDTKITPHKNALLKGFDNELYALFQVKANNEKEIKNPNKQLNLAIIIDRSGFSNMRDRPDSASYGSK